MSLIEVDNVSAGYGAAQILHGISIYVNEGELVTIIGPNGAGKSTLLKVIMGYLVPSGGRVVFRKKDITKQRTDERVKTGINYVPQLENIFPSLNVRENLQMGGYLLRSRNDVKEAIAMAYKVFPVLEEKKNQEAGTMSGGERQLLAMARALMLRPTLLLLDEPSAGLAPAAASRVFDKIKEINETGTSIIIVEQDAYLSLRLSDRGYVIATGQNKFQGDAQKILSDERIQKAYLGG